jgi:hypothetical protein
VTVNAGPGPDAESEIPRDAALGAADGAPGAGPAGDPPVEPGAVRVVSSGESGSGRQLTWLWAARGMALLVLAITVMVIALAIGMRANDNTIDDHLGTATATVLSVSPLRTGIEFVDINGTTIRPEGGVLYPGLLSVGQRFVVEYSTADPQIVRVAGRTASVGNWMLVLTAAVAYLIAGAVIWWCLQRARLPLLGVRRAPGHDATSRNDVSSSGSPPSLGRLSPHEQG